MHSDYIDKYKGDFMDSYEKFDRSEKVKTAFKAFGLGLVGCLAGGVFIILMHYYLGILSWATYLLLGIIAVVFYLNFISKEDRSIGSHIALDISFIIGSLIVWMADIAICVSGQFDVPDKPMNAIEKTFHLFFVVGGIDLPSSQDGSLGIATSNGSFTVWTWYVGFLLFTFIGAYIVFGIVKFDSIIMASDKKNKKEKNK